MNRKSYVAWASVALLSLTIGLFTATPANASIVNYTAVASFLCADTGDYRNTIFFHHDPASGSDQLYAVKIELLSGNAFWRIRVNEATSGQSNWITTADLTYPNSAVQTVNTTGSPWRTSGKESTVLYNQPNDHAANCQFGAVTFNK